MSANPLRFLVMSFLIAASCLATARASSEDVRHAFEGANRAFATATTPDQFRDVAARFESLRRNGGECGAVLFNLGNTWFRAGEMGRAIAAYREAERYLTRDPVLVANLAEARRVAGVAAPQAELADRLLFWRAWSSYPLAAQSAIVFAVLAFVFAGAVRLGVRKLVVPARIVSVHAALALLVFALEFHRFEIERRGVVVIEQVVARKGDAESYGPAFTAPLVEGQEVRVLDSRGGWTRVQLGNGIDGWVPEQSLVVW